MKFNFNQSLVPKTELRKILGQLKNYAARVRKIERSGDYSEWESSVCLPSDPKNLAAVLSLADKKVGKSLKYIVVVGIGGSNLGAKAVYDCLYGHFDALEPLRFPKMFFADTVDPEHLSRISEFLMKADSAEEILLIVISKSGTTVETAALGELLVSRIRGWFGKRAYDRIVFITDKDSKLWELGQKIKISVLEVPEKVGGRYSVFSAVGLFPLAACGFNVHDLLSGARQGLRTGLALNLEKNSAAISAAVLFYHYEKNRRVHDIFVFHPEFESAGKWYRQLMAESLGKEKNLEAKTVRAGILPTVSVGTTDLHSVGQLYFGGPNNRVTTFARAESNARAVIPKNGEFGKLVSGISGRDLGELQSIIYDAVKKSYRRAGMPAMELGLRDLSVLELGEFFQFNMLQIMYLGKLLNVNAFDQPGVEIYKKETARKLNELRKK